MKRKSNYHKGRHQIFAGWEKDQGDKKEIKVLDIPNYLHFENDELV